MPRPANPHPTDGELEILQVLSANGPTSLCELCETLRTKRAVAITTVATMLRVMRDKRLVKRQGAGRGAKWLAAVTHQAAAHGMVGKLVDHVFEGATDRLATHLVEGGALTRRQLNELQKLIETKTSSSRIKKGTRK